MRNLHDHPVVVKLLRRKDKIEALSWLKNTGPHVNVGEMTKQQSIQLVKGLYKLGVVEVVAVDIDGQDPEWLSTDSLIVTLPKSVKQRKSIFDWNNRRAAEMGFDPELDCGQAHLLVWFD